MPSVIDYKDVTIHRNSLITLKHVDLKVKQGEFVYIIGKVGSGKSSLLKSLYADVPVASGSAHVLDYDLRSIRKRDIPYLRRQIGIIFQDFRLLTDRSAEDNLRFVLRATGWRDKAAMDERIEAVLKSVGMTSASSHILSSLFHHSMKAKPKEINIKNRRATFDYEITETFTAGLVLTGTEIKSIREGHASLVDTFCYISSAGEVWVKNMNIAQYFYGTYNNHEARRDRKLLLNRKEIARLSKNGRDAGYTIVPLRLFINDRGFAKLVIGIARGKKEYDKRQSIKEREDKRALARVMQKR